MIKYPKTAAFLLYIALVMVFYLSSRKGTNTIHSSGWDSSPDIESGKHRDPGFRGVAFILFDLRIFLTSSLISSKIHQLFKGIFSSSRCFRNFCCFSCCWSLVLFYHNIILIFFSFVRLVLRNKIWSVLENILQVSENIVHSVAVIQNLDKYMLSLFYLWWYLIL